MSMITRTNICCVFGGEGFVIQEIILFEFCPFIRCNLLLLFNVPFIRTAS